MRINKNFKLWLGSAALLTLTACSSVGTSSDTSGISDASTMGTGGGVIGGDNVTTSGIGGADTFGGGSKALQVGNQSYYFDFDKSEVQESDMASIKVQAKFLNTQANAKILLAGNTDERGSREYNIALGQRRADSVANSLKMSGVEAKQITTVSYGAEKPAALGHTEEDYQKNRRVDLTYQTPITTAKK